MTGPRIVLMPRGSQGPPSEFGLVDPAKPDTYSGLGILQRASKTLTDAQIKALPTTGIEVIAAPGVGKVIFPVQYIGLLDARGGAYTNRDAAITGPNIGWNNAYGINQDFATADTVAMLTDLVNVSCFFAPLRPPNYSTRADAENRNVQVAIYNAASGNLTGGNAANSLYLEIFYFTVALP